jgi:hypothetical protein
LKKKIDDIALAMIDKVKEFEAIYMKSVRENLLETQSSFEEETNCLDKELRDQLRNPNVLIRTIHEMQSRQNEALNDIQSKLNEINQIKDKLQSANHFKSDLLSFNQDSFGSLCLREYNSSIDPFQSQILTGQHPFELMTLCEFRPNNKFTLLYRGIRDGFGSRDFHSKCDGHKNTLTVCKAKGSKFIFGGFTTADWKSSDYRKTDPNAFIFSLTNKENKPVKMRINPNHTDMAIYCDDGYGPSFGDGRDIKLANNANTTQKEFR